MTKEIVFDIETNGLNPDRIWCVVASELDSDQYHSFVDREEFAKYVEQNKGANWYAHNGFGFDFPVLRNLWDITFEQPQQRDTLVLSRLASPSRPGGHNLDNWGEILGYGKGDHSEWDRFSPEMLRYCERDVQLACRVLGRLNKELEGFGEDSIKLEHEVAPLIESQIRTGWLLDSRRCFTLLAELKQRRDELEEEVRKTFPPIAKFVNHVVPKIKKDGSTSKVGLKYLGEYALEMVGGEHSRIEWEVFNLGSRQQIAARLQKAGWKPFKFTETGHPVVSEEVLEEVTGIPECALIADYLTVSKRISQITSWLEAEEDDGRVRGYVNPNGAVTGRMTHSGPNMAQIPASGKPYGEECRACWIVPQGKKLVGVDADGLELRMLAHYMNDADYIKKVSEGDKEKGTDVHTANKNAAGLSSRDQAKTFIYAFLYGAGDAKIGRIVGGTKRDGAKLKQKFLDNTPALANLRERVGKAAKRGWLKGLDGRRIAVRSSHAALNTLLQGAGAVVMKKALVILAQEADKQELDYKFVGNIHDEIQAEVAEHHVEAYGNLAAWSIQEAGRQLNLRCPLAGGYQVGDSWRDTH